MPRPVLPWGWVGDGGLGVYCAEESLSGPGEEMGVLHRFPTPLEPRGLLQWRAVSLGTV